MSESSLSSKLPDWLQSTPPKARELTITFPAEHVVLITINRERFMNCLNIDTMHDLAEVWKWYDAEPSLRCSVLTGAGKRAFCAGMDIKERSSSVNDGKASKEFPLGGFAGMSNRTGKKPIIIACNGHAHGGGFEIVLNSDIIFASPNATFSLPEVLRGVAALAGGLVRCQVLFGNHRAMDLALTGRRLGAEEAVQWGLVKEIIPQDQLVEKAVECAKTIASNPPDPVIVSRLAAREAWETGVTRATARGAELYGDVILKSENAAEGLRAFKEKRKPNWKPSRL